MAKFFSILFFSYCISIFAAKSISFQGLIIQSNLSGQGNVNVFKNNKKEDSFDYYGINGGLSCNYPKVFEEKKNVLQREFVIKSENTESINNFNVQSIQVYSSKNEDVQVSLLSEFLVKIIDKQAKKFTLKQYKKICAL